MPVEIRWRPFSVVVKIRFVECISSMIYRKFSDTTGFEPASIPIERFQPVTDVVFHCKILQRSVRSLQNCMCSNYSWRKTHNAVAIPGHGCYLIYFEDQQFFSSPNRCCTRFWKSCVLRRSGETKDRWTTYNASLQRSSSRTIELV